MNIETRNWREWTMPVEASAYIESFREADKLARELKMLADDIEQFTRTIKEPRSAPYQTVPQNWPSGQVLQDKLNAAKAACDRMKTMFAQVPAQQRPHVPHPDTIGSGRATNRFDPSDTGYC